MKVGKSAEAENNQIVWCFSASCSVFLRSFHRIFTETPLNSWNLLVMWNWRMTPPAAIHYHFRVMWISQVKKMKKKQNPTLVCPISEGKTANSLKTFWSPSLCRRSRRARIVDQNVSSSIGLQDLRFLRIYYPCLQCGKTQTSHVPRVSCCVWWLWKLKTN